MYKYHNRERVLKIFEELTNQSNIKKFLDILKAHHHDTYEHSLRVAKLSIDLALENNLPLRVVRTIGKAALLHDFGKSRIDGSILSKSGPLDEREHSLMERHPRLGVTELRKHLSEEVRKIIVSHHEFKAKPYPRHKGERRESIREDWYERRRKYSVNPYTQIVAAADMYDALSFPRAYKKAFDADVVRNIMIEEFAGRPVLIAQLINRPRNDSSLNGDHNKVQ